MPGACFYLIPMGLTLIQVNIFRNWSMLNSWSDDDIKNLSYTSRMEEFSHNKVIVKDAKKNEFLWFVIRVSS